MIRINRLDHLVLTVKDLERTCDFYNQVLGFEVVTFGENRTALVFGTQKINLHKHGEEFEPKAARATPGSADICLITTTPLVNVLEKLDQLGIGVEEGIVPRTGATGNISSVYIRDPDENLIEISKYDK